MAVDAKTTRTAKTARSDAERAALAILKVRTALVGEAAAAKHTRDQLATDLAAADDSYTAAYDAARTGGWTADELARMQLPAPASAAAVAKPAGGARRSARPTAPAPRATPAPGVEQPAVEQPIHAH